MKITIVGDAVVITSALKLKDIEKIEQNRPEALVVKGGEDGKEPVFSVGTTTGSGRINQYGASFGSETHDEAKLATITMSLCEGFSGDVREYVADELGAAVTYLEKLEETIPGVLEEIAAERASVLEHITVAQ